MIKWLKICTLIIIVNLNSINDAAANNLFVPDNRFTAGAQAADYSQCASLWGVYIYTRTTVKVSCMSACIAAAVWAGGSGTTVCPPTCWLTAEAAAWAALWATYTGYNAWAEEIRQNSKIVNTIDSGKPACGSVGGNLNNSANFVFDSNQTYQGWDRTGPLANYCYNEGFNHHLKENEDIYNGGDGKIGISYEGNSPVWIKPEDCDTIATNDFESLIGAKRHFCAWTEGDEICAEAVFCTGLLFGDIVPVYGFVGDPTRLTSKARRPCGDDPYSDGVIDDFMQNKRCECFCCEGSNSGNQAYDICSDLPNNRTCKTYNERYNAHCIKKPIVEEDFESPIVPPRTISHHCKMGVLSGYKDFSFVGKAVRCFTKTIHNIYFGIEELPVLNPDGSQAVDLQGSPQYTSQCIDGQSDGEGGCTKSLYKTIQDRFAGLLSIVLTLWVLLTGIKFLMVGGMSKGDFFKYALQFGVVLYFVNGNGWRDGYYDFLMYGGYELSSGYFEATVNSANTDTLSNIATTVDFGAVDADTVASCSFSDLNIATEESWNRMQQCNFFDGIDPSGNHYSDDERYYAVLDSLDCRFSRYLGIDRNDFILPELLVVATAIVFDTPSGFIFFIAALAFFVCSLILLLKIAFMLISIAMMISFLIYVSPIVIPLMLFDKTKKIFSKWLGLLIGYSLQPFLILSLIALIILLIDGFFITYLEPLYSIGGVEYKEVGLGASAPSISGDYNDSALVSNMIKFLFLLVVVVHIFNKFGSILNSLSGAADVGSFIKPPDFKGGRKKGAKAVGKAARKTGKYAAIKGRQKIGDASRAYDSFKEQKASGGQSSDDKGGGGRQNVNISSDGGNSNSDNKGGRGGQNVNISSGGGNNNSDDKEGGGGGAPSAPPVQNDDD